MVDMRPTCHVRNDYFDSGSCFQNSTEEPMMKLGPASEVSIFSKILGGTETPPAVVLLRELNSFSDENLYFCSCPSARIRPRVSSMHFSGGTEFLELSEFQSPP